MTKSTKDIIVYRVIVNTNGKERIALHPIHMLYSCSFSSPSISTWKFRVAYRINKDSNWHDSCGCWDIKPPKLTAETIDEVLQWLLEGE